jgi:hypothetical protein
MPQQTIQRKQRMTRTYRLGSCWKTSATVRTMDGVRDAAPHISTVWMSAATMLASFSASIQGCCTRCRTGAASSSNLSRATSDLQTDNVIAC